MLLTQNTNGPAANNEATNSPAMVATTDQVSAEPVLSLRELTIASANATLVDQLSYDLFSTQTLAIVGESGSGKSISSLALLGLLANSLSISGELTLAGVGQLPLANKLNLTSSATKQDKRREHGFQQIRGTRIGMIFQEPMTALNPLHTVGRQLAESLMLAGVKKSEIAQQRLNLLNDVNITDPKSKLTRYPHELSGGQRQRVMIAMALAQRPEILIADEPTTALDVTLQHDVLSLLNRLKAEYGMAMILISHDLNLVRRYSDNIIVMRQGRVVEQGATEALFANPQADYTKLLMAHDFGKALTLKEPQGNLPIEQLDNVGKPAAHKPTAHKPMAPLLTTDNLRVAYPLTKGWLGSTKTWSVALEALNITLQPGYALGIVGESGSGKTTAALAIARLLSLQAQVTGKTQIAGQDIYSLSKAELRKFRAEVQMVFQDPFASINPRFTVRQIVEEGLLVQGQDKTSREQAVMDALATVQLPPELADRYPHELSGGQRQRVALARALVMRPKLIILDEPTSALDSTTQVAVVALLRQIQRDFGIGYIFISHDLNVVRALCQHIIVLKAGQCVEMAETEALFNHPQHAYSRQLMQASVASADFS